MAPVKPRVELNERNLVCKNSGYTHCNPGQPFILSPAACKGLVCMHQDSPGASDHGGDRQVVL